jgi:transcriptional regulator with XRE-family HTH domain
MEQIHDRLKKAREARGYRSASDASMALGVREAAYRHHENGTRGITTERARAYATFFRVPFEWLVAGPQSGIPDPTVKLTSGPRELRYIPDPEPTDVEHNIEHATTGSETGTRGIPPDGIAQLDASGGMGGGGLTIVNEGVPGKNGMTFSAESISDYWRLPNSIVAALSLRNTDIIVLPVKGTSMLPILAEGDFVFIDTRHRRPSPDGIYALADDFDEIIVKTLRAVDGPDGSLFIEIVSSNPEFPVRRRNPDDLRIIGRVIRKFSTIGGEWSASMLDNISTIAKSESMDRKRIRDVIIRVEEEFGTALTPDQKCEMIMAIYDGHEPRFTKKPQKDSPLMERSKATK